MKDVLIRFAVDTSSKIDPNSIGVPKVDFTKNVLADVFSATLVFVGGMAVLFLLIGAARYVTANGEQAKVTQAKNTILYAIIGVFISSLGFTIVQFVAGRLTGTLK
jgi:cytochrome c biogenesis protein CcdA